MRRLDREEHRRRRHRRRTVYGVLRVLYTVRVHGVYTDRALHTSCTVYSACTVHQNIHARAVLQIQHQNIRTAMHDHDSSVNLSSGSRLGGSYYPILA